VARRRRLSGHDDDARPAQRRQGLAPRARRQEPHPSGPPVGGDEDDVHLAPDAPMLERIVEHGDVGAEPRCLGDAGRPIRVGDHRETRVEESVDPSLVTAIAAKDDRRRAGAT
jgi:hypothetical protein